MVIAKLTGESLLSIQLTGKPMINGQPTGSIKALEFAYLLSENGGRIEKTDIYTRLYNGYCSRNALWYPVETCKRYGLNIHYSSEELIYTSNNEIVSDLGLIFSKLKEDDILSALFYLRGPILPGTSDWFSENIRDLFNSTILKVLSSVKDSERMKIEHNLKLRGISL